MYEITVKQWTKIEKLVYDKNKEIEEIQEKLEKVELENRMLTKALCECSEEKSKLEEENTTFKKELEKQSKELKISNSNLSLVLQKLNTTFGMLEDIGYRRQADSLANRKSRITNYDIDRLFDTKA